MNLLTVIFLAIAFFLNAPIPGHSQGVIPDGNMNDDEWKGATIYFKHDSVQVLVKQDSSNFYIGFKLKATEPRYVDLYIRNGGQLKNLHASFQLGERLLPDTGFTDSSPEWKWGNNRLWKSNVVKYLPSADEKLSLKMQLKAYDGIEFVIKKEMFAAKEILLFAEVKGFEEGVSGVLFPANAVAKNADHWIRIKLN